MAADGSDQRNLTRTPDAYDFYPAWSPDGTRIAFVRDVNGVTGPSSVLVMNADGTNVVRLTSATRDFLPAWSPDGTRITFSSTRDGNFEIYVMNADGSGQTNLTRNAAAGDEGSVWSPDGRQIVFCRRGKIQVMAADGSAPTDFRDTAGAVPTWSPDGSRIIFQSMSDPGDDLWVMAPDGSDLRPLFVSPLGAIWPAWSPDGRRIAYSDSAGPGDIWVMNADGTGSIAITANSATGGTDPDWQTIPLGPVNVVGNPSFEASLAGWGSFGGTLSRAAVTGAPDGAWVARATWRSGSPSYSVSDNIAPSAPTVSSTTAGAAYIGSCHVRAATTQATGRADPDRVA